jgi:hypothetical protein
MKQAQNHDGLKLKTFMAKPFKRFFNSLCCAIFLPRSVIWCQFHQHFTYKFFVRTLFWQLFLHNYVTREKGAETKFVQKIPT